VALAATGKIQSAHDISDGGLAVTVAESCFATPSLGARIVTDNAGPAESAVFGERGARAVVSVSASSADSVLEIARQHDVAATRFGQVTGDGIFSIQYHGSVIIEESVAALRDIWSHALERALKQ
jgi:phosphoribosylformylglycinamidine synthase